jgi:hypothetical protein
VVSKALETNRISLNEINSCSSAFLERFQHGAQHRERLIVEAKQIIATSPLFAPWRLPGANINSNAQTENEPKSTSSAVQNSGAQ